MVWQKDFLKTILKKKGEEPRRNTKEFQGRVGAYWRQKKI